MPLSVGQIENVLRKAGIDTGRTQEFTGRGEFSGTAGQEALFRELTGGMGGFQAEEQQAKRAAFETRQAGEEQEFLGRFRTEFPQIISGIEGELGLPGLRETAFTSVEQFKDLPEAIRQATQGKDVSARQLERIESSRQAERLPQIQDLLSSLQFGEEEFGRRAERALVPFETEIGLMKDRLSREATGFNQDSESRFGLLLQKLQNEGSLAVAELQEATQLAQLEEAKLEFENSLTSINLGDRVALIDPRGNEVSSFEKGLAPKRIGTLQDEWEFT